MKSVWLAGAAFALMAGAAHAQDHTGLSVGVGALNVDGSFSFSGGKPTQELRGTLGVVSVGADYQFGHDGGLVVGAGYFTTIGDGVQSPPNRDGNYLVQDGRIDKLSGWEGRAGWAFGPFELYGAYGQTREEAVTRQSCPADWNAAPFGFCHGGGVAATGIARQGTREGDASKTMNVWSLGANYAFTQHVSLDARYSQGDYGSQIVTLDPTGDTPGQTAHPPTDPHQNPSWWTVQLTYRF